MHPLSGISHIPFMVLAHGGARSAHLSKLHQMHPVIRTGPNSLSYGDVRAIKDIYGHKTPCTKDSSYVVSSGSHYHLADVIDKHEHARKRKLLSSAYALKNLEDWEHKVADKTTNFFTLNAIADIGLSEKLGFLNRGHDRVTGRRLDGTTYECNLRDCLYQNLRKQSLLIWSRIGAFARDWDGIPIALSHQRLQRYQSGEKLNNFFQALMEDKNGQANNLKWGEIVAEISIIMNAGSVTTAIAMTNVLYQLLKNLEMMAKVVEELEAAIDEDEDDDEDDEGGGVVAHDKSLRLFPPTPHGLPRETPLDGINVFGDYIPSGVSVAMSAFVAHRQEGPFLQADKYIPERWLGDEGKALQPYFLAFSAGARGCIGRNISYLEQTVVLASALRRYEFALPRPDWQLERLETMNWLVGNMPVKVWRREKKSQVSD
ncbi:cytochrome P450 [Pleomassaria siparia CBS 279.74]|uniref:Cytochrome P450 n=1 Tax=Pleomassaria siparia CBS 279.74 TaxID=1314801 RepID=A0A6G1JRN2_9PLEO|nr:cytochrome P450 [Pleomassaria siparia CBS 279.74]